MSSNTEEFQPVEEIVAPSEQDWVTVESVAEVESKSKEEPLATEPQISSQPTTTNHNLIRSQNGIHLSMDFYRGISPQFNLRFEVGNERREFSANRDQFMEHSRVMEQLLDDINYNRIIVDEATCRSEIFATILKFINHDGQLGEGEHIENVDEVSRAAEKVSLTCVLSPIVKSTSI